MTVYVITQGEYSDYSIRAVSLDKNEAEKICALLNRDARCVEYCEVEEYDTDDMVVDTAEEVKKKFEMSIDSKTGEITWFSELYLTFENCDRVYFYKEYDFESDKKIKVVATLPTNTTEEQAKKIMLDRAAKFKAEKVGL